MKIQRRHVGVLSGLLALGAMFGPGCAENKSSLFVRGAMLVPTDSCEVQADASAPLLFRGVFDTAFAAEYHAVLLVGNQLVRRGNSATLRTETSRIQLNSADVVVTDSNGATLSEYSVPISGFIDPGTSTEPGFGAASVVIVDAAAAAAAGPFTGRQAKEVIANVILHGVTLGDEDIDSGEWAFPIDVCRGCLVTFPPDADIPGDGKRDCNNTDDSVANCRPGLDSPVDCRLCTGLVDVCTP